MFRLKISKADRLFSIKIRSRDKWTCRRCYRIYEPPTMALHCSHFWGRGNKGTRFDPENAVALCYGCHRYFTSNPVEHSSFFLKLLGQTKFDALGIRARTPTKIDEKMIALGLEVELKAIGVI